ncbi:MAG TPA: iron-only hydrogenase system regulator [Candidatus Faecaligallichristensenella faecipullorum]|nr:iron-only hydrogenase system regulator [Candidatus Faecaligallichristensenella faecipullorum]
MENRIALIGIIVEDLEAAPAVNAVLHEFARHVVGRMGIPCPERHLSIISVVIDAPADIINALGGRLGRIPGISVKSQMARLRREEA